MRAPSVDNAAIDPRSLRSGCSHGFLSKTIEAAHAAEFNCGSCANHGAYKFSPIHVCMPLSNPNRFRETSESQKPKLISSRAATSDLMDILRHERVDWIPQSEALPIIAFDDAFCQRDLFSGGEIPGETAGPVVRRV